MKLLRTKILSLTLALLIAVPIFSGCGKGEITDVAVIELFERAAKEIIALASEEPESLIKTILGDDMKVVNKEKNIDGKIYYETTAKYMALQNHYAEIFSGEALAWVLSTKFADVAGVLYCLPSGGATGWSIVNTKVSKVNQDNGISAYKATFSRIEGIKEPEAPTTSLFSIEKTAAGYRVSSIDYSPDLLGTPGR